MTNLPRVRRRLITAMMVLGLLDVVAAVVLLWPLMVPASTRQAHMQALQSEVQKKIRVVVPPEQLQTRIVEARQQINAFYKDRLPSEYSAISAQLGKLAAEQQVTLSQAKYTVDDAEIPGLRLVSIDASMIGNYLQEVRFINALERSPLLFVVNSVTLGDQTGGRVRLDLKLETYLKVKA